MNVTGRIIVLNDTEEVGTKGFKKRLLVVQTNEQYPQTIPIEFVQEKTELLNTFQIGQEVEVSINLRGSEYNGRYYAQLHGWSIKSQSDF